ncbi:hypothetical protein RLOC_00006244 [Lonchura striata]|uniref:Integrase-type domain-containing protein n=1 Tax=Lonchura striata TaxID=40157 RepID=A0A218UQF2_9PASE|nr:hypothetical protein RLOC_00006244 [Lonchura striata domestica]
MELDKKGQILAQAIPILVEITVEGKSPEVYWAEVVGEDRPSMACNLAHGSEHLQVEGVLDTGADIMKNKVQRMPPWRYLVLEISARTIVMQKLDINCKPRTLADLHLLCGSLNWSSASLQLSLDNYRGQISVHALSHKLFNDEFRLFPQEKGIWRPLKALTVFTDASGASHKSVMIWRNPQTQHWEADVELVEGSPQVDELAAVTKLSHQHYHQNVPGLIRQFQITLSQARAIVANCPNCQLQAMPSLGMGVNPQGLSSCEWGVVHKTGIAHSPTGQAVVECAHQTLKQVLKKQNNSAPWMSPREKLCKAMFTINFRNCSFENTSPPVVRHFNKKTYLPLNPVMNLIQAVILLMLNNQAAAWIVPQPRQNVWVTLAQTLQQENICLSTAAAKDPMSTCLAIKGLIPSTSEVNHIELANLRRPDYTTNYIIE